MATEVFINIKDLPELTQINIGDYIVVETSTGTHILNFENLILPVTNTAITNSVIDINTTLVNLSSYVNDSYNTTQTLATNVASQITEITNNLTDTSNSSNTNLQLLSSYTYNLPKIYVGKTQVTIGQSGKIGNNVLFPAYEGSDLDASDIIVTPANLYAARFPAYVDDLTDGVVRLKGSYTAYSISGTTVVQVDSVAAETAIYNVVAIKKY
jgi:hypothetical protein